MRFRNWGFLAIAILLFAVYFWLAGGPPGAGKAEFMARRSDPLQFWAAVCGIGSFGLQVASWTWSAFSRRRDRA